MYLTLCVCAINFVLEEQTLGVLMWRHDINNSTSVLIISHLVMNNVKMS